MAFQGISVTKENGCVVCIIDEFSEQIKLAIKDRLTSICHGGERAGKNLMYMYARTLEQFYDRYSGKKEDTKMGMIGELLCHLLLPEVMEQFNVASIFFNKEERSMKKGFDMVLYEKGGRSLWYSEVKSGRPHGLQDATSKSIDLLHTAERDVLKKLSGKNDTLWLNAMHDLDSTIGDADVREYLQNILATDSTTINIEQARTKNVVLMSVAYEPTSSPISHQSIQLCHNDIIDKGKFSNVVVFAIQKETYSKIEDYMFRELSSKNEE